MCLKKDIKKICLLSTRYGMSNIFISGITLHKRNTFVIYCKYVHVSVQLIEAKGRIIIANNNNKFRVIILVKYKTINCNKLKFFRNLY